ncbi:unnamed protein product [Peronospora farinosa]|uniref:Uncharacterized protein n=1 Tax=Peronospora farinosa TaxID=134698 RepID=A0ABN8BWQ7_9STRA|nr:unnamed protein product [Peronospora farinosa]
MNVADQRNSSSPIPIEVSVVSDTTISSSDRSRSDSSSDSSADALDDDYGAHVLSSSEDDDEMNNDDELRDKGQDVQQDITNHLLVKSMTSGLQGCPVDDLAVEDEKRRRRSRRNLKKKSKGKNAPLMGISRDTESLPSMLRPIMVRTRRSGSSPVLSVPNMSTSSTTSVSYNRPSSARGRGQTVAFSPAAVVLSNDTGVASTSPLLRKDSAAIRRQYWSQLGFSLSRSDLEKSTGRKKERRDGLKVRLNDADSKNKQGAKSFFRFIASWYAPVTAVSGEDKTSRKDRDRTASARQLRSSLLRHSLSSVGDNSDVLKPKKGVQFNEEAELFYIPLHRDYSKRQRECMWPTRADFVAMVERNLDAVYDEMEREYEAQLENEYLENEGMAREETRQRTIEAQERKAAESAAESRRSLSPPRSRSSSTISSSVPMLALSQKQVIVSPRARSSHDLRFKYLKHLGIDS